MRCTYRGIALALLAAGALAGCGGKNPTAPGSTGGTTDDFAAAVQASYPSGAVLPTTLEAQSSLLASLEVEGLAAGAALFRVNSVFVNAGRVSVASGGAIVASPADTLVRRAVLVYNTPWYLYTSIPDLPHLPPFAFNGTAWHHFKVSGSSSFAAFEDSVLSVTPPQVSAPAGAAGVPRSADLAVSWSDGSPDTTVYVLTMVRSNVDTSRVALGTLVRDQDGATTVASTLLSVLPLGPARLSVGRYRIARRLNGALAVNLVCEAVALRALTLQ